MTEPAPDTATIYLPQPDGHRRGCLRYRNGLTQEIDATPEELDQLIDEFLAGDEPSLSLRDARFGDLYTVRRHALQEELLDVLVAWVKNPAPAGGRRELVVAREHPRMHPVRR